MDWEKEALEFFDANVMAGPSQLAVRKIYTEKLARQKNKKKVTRTEVEQTIKDYVLPQEKACLNFLRLKRRVNPVSIR
jgi:hypothetical protein